MNPSIDPNVPMWRLTVGEFTELVKSLQQPIPMPELKRERVTVKGIRGIQSIFHCSEWKAKKMKKSGVIDEAISQDGRTIVVDVDKALELRRLDLLKKKKKR